MDKIECGQAPFSASKKEKKKKKSKDEMDRLKAEKKKRRLEKALATSAAIRFELEKKKQMMKEEQQRLDDEGAAIAESVALHVLGGEEQENPTQIMLRGNGNYDIFDNSRGFSLFMDPWGFRKFTSEGLGWAPDSRDSGLQCNSNLRMGWTLGSEMRGRHLQVPLFEETGRLELSHGVVAANAFSALQISEDSYGDSFGSPRTAAIVWNRMMQSNQISSEPNFYEEY